MKWRCMDGAVSVNSEAYSIPAQSPIILQGHSLFLDPLTLAELAQVECDIDPQEKSVKFRKDETPAETPISEYSISGGWQAFTIAKPEKPEPERSSHRRRMGEINLPPSHSQMNLGFGVGYVQGHDWGMELTARGNLSGGNINLNTLLTQGTEGLKIDAARLNWIDREQGEALEIGDLYSQSWGFVRGFRYSWNAHGERWPSLGFYTKTSGRRATNPTAVISYRDRLKLAPGLVGQGELGSDLSRFLNLSYEDKRIGLYAFDRSMPEGFSSSRGFFTSYAIAPRWSLFYSNYKSTDTLQDNSSEAMGIRIPFINNTNLLVERKLTHQERRNAESYSAMWIVPFQNLRLLLRFQQNMSDLLSVNGAIVSAQTSNLLTALTYHANRRMHFDFQINRFSHPDGVQFREQLITNYTISPETRIQAVTGFPNIADSSIARLRLMHDLADDLSLVMDYGRLAPYQRVDDLFGKRGFKIMLRKSWSVRTPNVGGSVSGMVKDQLGKAVEGITVRLGKYSAITGKDGRYEFSQVPSGVYDILLLEESVPTEYNIFAQEHKAVVCRNTEIEVDFELIPLGYIGGRVYFDDDGDGRFDDDGPSEGIAIKLNGFATSANKDGRFSFYNLEPGVYRVSVAKEVLPRYYRIVGDGEIEVTLEPQGSITGLEFRLRKERRPVQFETLEWEVR